MNFKIAIPSLSRADIICHKTLKLCKLFNIPQDKIYIFVILPEKCSYIFELKKHNLENINIIVGPIGLDKMRNFITNYFDEGEYLLNMDDDIDAIYKLSIDTTITDLKKASRYKLLEIKDDFISLINNTFEICKKENIGLFGIYPVKNGYFMKSLPDITYDLRFCVGTLWGCINDKSIIINIEEKEDFDRTLQYYIKYGKILRLNTITIKTRYYKTQGGMQQNNIDRKETSKESCKYLLEKYPKYTKLYNGKKSGIFEVKLSTCT
jgi:hypothetical protein